MFNVFYNGTCKIWLLAWNKLVRIKPKDCRSMPNGELANGGGLVVQFLQVKRFTSSKPRGMCALHLSLQVFVRNLVNFNAETKCSKQLPLTDSFTGPVCSSTRKTSHYKIIFISSHLISSSFSLHFWSFVQKCTIFVGSGPSKLTVTFFTTRWIHLCEKTTDARSELLLSWRDPIR